MPDFIPTGWHFFDSTAGDLNKDKLADLVLVVERDAAEEENADSEYSPTVEGPPRVLLVLFQQKKGGYRRSVRADRLVMRNGEGGSLVDPWISLEVDRGSLVVGSYGGGWWRWRLDYRFRFQNDDWFLIGATNLSYHSGTGEMESYDYNLLTGDVEITKGNMFGEKCVPCLDCEACETCEGCGECERCVPEEDEVERKNIGKKPLRRMEDFVPMEWEIMPEQYL